MPGNSAAADPAEILRLEGIRKSFPGVLALDGVDFGLRRGEVHVLLGENGAGKSTLVKILSGAYRPEAGRIRVDGREVRPGSTRDAQRLGIATIHQEFSLVPELSVAENIFLGRQPRRFGLVDRGRLERAAEEVLDRVGLDLPPRTRLAELGVARRQLVEIAQALSREARILVMDEPTAALAASETEQLFRIVRRLRAQSVGLVFITHHLEEIAALGDRVTVLRDGRVAGELPATAPAEDLVRLMVGRTLSRQYPPRERKSTKPDAAAATVTGAPDSTTAQPPDPSTPPPLLHVEGLSRQGAFQDVSFEVRAGEVVGLAGLVGAGRTEVVRALFGADPYEEGSVRVAGVPLPRHDIRAAMAAGLGLVPEDRKGQGLLPGASVADNLGLVTLRTATRAGFVDRGAQRTAAARIAERLGVRMASLDQRVGTLSGGNQQKVVLGRWLLSRTRLLLLDEPTRGIDVGAKAEIHRLVREFTAAGNAVLMVSSELPEVLGMSDRILVMAEGRLAGELPAATATQDAVMALAIASGSGSGSGSGNSNSNSNSNSNATSRENHRTGGISR
ncbi:sugar ABC transporter ATP-binding protein [Streptomyces physcomitrii]|uniref:Sugar ABC transporter ATP-binding protein n=1 Tax=Streptomyces physcomitrii TaxID=2724184 RepID=A0ABX1GW55_9ACTN|nr:sugar ABC transporter ATP-binding protein [Streptomyces physcomitrii]NKI40292.1 sugar ABC transporter ATP-binding protein [Streptomyces physcomitrii]